MSDAENHSPLNAGLSVSIEGSECLFYDRTFNLQKLLLTFHEPSCVTLLPQHVVT